MDNYSSTFFCPLSADYSELFPSKSLGLYTILFVVGG